MIKQFRLSFILKMLLLAGAGLSCSVDKKEVPDAPPNLRFAYRATDYEFGKIEITIANKQIANSFVALLWPVPSLYGGSETTTSYWQHVEYLKNVKTTIDPLTRDIFLLFREMAVLGDQRSQWRCDQGNSGGEARKPGPDGFCDSWLDFGCDATPKPGPDNMCDEWLDFNCMLETPTGAALISRAENAPQSDCADLSRFVATTPFDQITIPNCSALEDDDEEEQKRLRCECATSAVTTLNGTRESTFETKLSLARCAWRRIDPNPHRIQNWYFGGDRHDHIQVGESEKETQVAEVGSSLSLKRLDSGEVEVRVKLINFNGNNYSTHASEESGAFAEIKEAKYEKERGILTFNLHETSRGSTSLTGRIWKFQMSRTTPLQSVDQVTRFEGEIRVYNAQNEMVRVGQARFDGEMVPHAEEAPPVARPTPSPTPSPTPVPQ